MAQSVIFYFSQNGHTKALAERIAARLEAGALSCDVVDITGAQIPDMKEYKMIFVSSPVYYGLEPLVWEKFIDMLPNLSGKAGFVVSTFGAENGKGTDTLMVNNLSSYLLKKNLKVLSSHGVLCEDTWPPLKKVGVSKGRPNADDLDKLDTYVEKIISDYKTGKVDRAVYDFGVTIKKNSFGNLLGKLLLKVVPKVKVEASNCTRCGFCKNACPAGNIEIANCAIINKDCMKCYNCEKVCLNKAIKVNWKFWDYVCEKLMKNQKV